MFSYGPRNAAMAAAILSDDRRSLTISRARWIKPRTRHAQDARMNEKGGTNTHKAMRTTKRGC